MEKARLENKWLLATKERVGSFVGSVALGQSRR
jgi:hypothetical protein